MRSTNKHVVVLLTDLSMAYDLVDHALLLALMEHLWIHGIALKLMTTYLEEIKLLF